MKKSLIQPIMAKAIAKAQTSQGRVQTGRVLETLTANNVLKNTYLLLAATLIFSAMTAGVSMKMGLPHLGIILTLVGYFGLLYAVHATSKSGWGLVSIFALTGFLGLTVGPILSAYMTFLPNGEQLVAMAFTGTGITFIGLSGYALVSKRDFSPMAGFLLTGLIVAFCAGLAAIFLDMPVLSVAVSAAFILLSSGIISWSPVKSSTEARTTTSSQPLPCM